MIAALIAIFFIICAVIYLAAMAGLNDDTSYRDDDGIGRM